MVEIHRSLPSWCDSHVIGMRHGLGAKDQLDRHQSVLPTTLIQTTRNDK